MRYDEKGQLIDDPCNNSPDAELARFLTKSYHRIGFHLPEMLRLKELAEISMLVRFIHSVYQNIVEYINDTKDIRRALKLLSDQIGDYPENTDLNIRKYYENFLSEHSISKKKLTSEEDKEIRQNIYKKLAEDDVRILDQCTEAIYEWCRSKFSDTLLRPEVKHWLLTGYKSHRIPRNDTQLVHRIGEVAKQYKQEKYSKIMENIARLSIDLEQRKSRLSHLDNIHDECSWVPAVFGRYENSSVRIYDGVSLSLSNPKKVSLSAIDGKRNIDAIPIQQVFDTRKYPKQMKNRRKEEKKKGEGKSNIVKNRKVRKIHPNTDKTEVKAYLHFVRCENRKDAKERARRAGYGTPIHHTGKPGEYPHFHPQEKMVYISTMEKEIRTMRENELNQIEHSFAVTIL
ncbi:unnamed protein product [Didymodactylos carnosus]|uniref:Uncharacterized protein n=1 Tax=Didymodactylos carnosus TaxID=1234261 RepID=A0A815RUE5_9BILA|nr:unnamed protein product [Didymodactylos carnosus]CAF4345626.1 unnamed protein product [Didymodactylos carnosus]